MKYLLLTIFVDYQGTGFEAPRVSNTDIFDSYDDCENAIINEFRAEGYFTLGKDVRGIYGKWSGGDFDGYLVCAPTIAIKD